MNCWHNVVKSLPKEYEVVLTIHEDDLYPACAYYMKNNSGELFWFREIEGPEDLYFTSRHEPLFRSPTHWRALPPRPKSKHI